MDRKKKRFPIGQVIAAIIIVLIAAAVINPDLLFFLTDGQRAVIADFQNTYFTKHMPRRLKASAATSLNMWS